LYYYIITNKYKLKHSKGKPTSLPLIGVYVFWSHKLTYESGLAHSSWSHQWHRVRSYVVPTFVLPVLLLLLMLKLLLLLHLLAIIVVQDRWRAFLGVVFSGQAVAPRPAFPKRISSVHNTCRFTVFLEKYICIYIIEIQAGCLNIKKCILTFEHCCLFQNVCLLYTTF